MTITEKLATLTGRLTRYECIAENEAGQRILLGYCVRTGRRSLLETAQRHGPQLIEWLKIQPDATLCFLTPAGRGATIGAASLRFSGRTQREAIQSGELPFIGDFTA